MDKRSDCRYEEKCRSQVGEDVWAGLRAVVLTRGLTAEQVVKETGIPMSALLRLRRGSLW